MKYCSYCGSKINENQEVCLNCGKILNIPEKVQSTDKDEGIVALILCAIIGLFFPIIGAILYYILKNSYPKCARIANICSWIGFIPYLLGIIMII